MDNVDAWREVLSFLEPLNILQVSATCKLFRGLCCEPQLWRRCCRDWWASNGHSAHEAMPSGWPEGLPSKLGLTTWPAAYKALHMLGLDPIGIWTCSTKQPRGQLVLVHFAQGKIRAVDMDPLSPDGWVPDDKACTFEISFSEGACSPSAVLGAELMLPPVCMSMTFFRFPGTDDCSPRAAALERSESDTLCISWPLEAPAPGSVISRVRRGFESLLPTSGTLPSPLPPEASSWHFRHKYQRVQLLPGTSSHSDLEADAFRRLQHLEGLWCASYGGHGMEIIQVSLSSELPSEQTGGLEGLRLVGRKLTGDPNVPASELSFTAKLLDTVEVESMLDDEQLVVAIPMSGPVVVDLTARGMDCALAGLGQINRLPGLWAPEWIAANIITYRGSRDKLSVLWLEMNPDSQWQHITDFRRMAIPRGWSNSFGLPP